MLCFVNMLSSSHFVFHLTSFPYPLPFHSFPSSPVSPLPPPSLPPLLQPPTVKDEKQLKGLKDGAQLRLMLCLEKEEEKNKGRNRWAEEVKLIGGDFAVYAETVSKYMYIV